MNKNHKYIFVIFASLFSTVLLVISCNKDDVITGVVAQETYVNKTGHDMRITRFMKGQPQKVYDISNEDTLYIENIIDAGTDSTASLFRADSAEVLFADGKKYSVTDTARTTTPNFLKARHTISPSGKIHYYRYTFTTGDYGLAE